MDENNMSIECMNKQTSNVEMEMKIFLFNTISHYKINSNITSSQII